jgi:hypothetical protein
VETRIVIALGPTSTITAADGTPWSEQMPKEAP